LPWTRITAELVRDVGMGKNSVTIRDCVAHACLLLPSAFVYALVCQAVGVRSVEWDRSLFSRDAMIALSRWARRGGIGPISYCVRASVSDVLATFSLSLGYRSWRSREWVKGGAQNWKTLVSVTAYHAFGGEVEAQNTPHDTPPCRARACGDSELAGRYDAVRRQLSETITSTRRSAYRRHEPSEAVRRS
jgi:hypothetical protein